MKWIFIVFLCISSSIIAQKKSTNGVPYTSYKNHFIYFNDFGFSAAPFNIKNNFKLGKQKVRFDHNWKPILGIGVAWRWLSFRFGLGLPFNLRNKEKYGETKNFHLGAKFNIKRFHLSLSYDNYRGYVIKNEKNWNDSTTAKYIERNLVRSQNYTIAGWYFFDRKFNINAFTGIKASYHSEGKSWYIRPQFSVFNTSNKRIMLAPDELIIAEKERTQVHRISVFELGVIPGYAYVNNFKNWQFGVFAGLGGVIQSKGFTTPNVSRHFIGIEPRADFRLTSGYTKEKFFIFLDAQFDFKSTRFQDLVYEQTYYNVRVTAGYRIKTKPKKKKKKKNKRA